MTAKQREVLDVIHNLMLEHFDACVYVVQNHDVGDRCLVETAGGFTAGIALAIGLCEVQKHKLLKQQMDDFDDAREEL